MNYISHLSRFYERLYKDTRLKANHISLYLALFQCWNSYRFENPFPLIRERLMRLSGIGSKNTYGKCLKELHQYGYIVHSQSLHKYHWPRVSIVRLASTPGVAVADLFTAQEPVKNTGPGPAPPVPELNAPAVKNGQESGSDQSSLMVKIGTLPVPVLGHIIKQFINKENKESGAHAQNPVEDRSRQIQTGMPAGGPEFKPPALENVEAYFRQAGFPESEAALFFNHYQSNGWKQAGKVPITDWRAAAGKWICYDKKFKTGSYGKSGKHSGTNHLHVEQNKNYSDPL